VATLWTSIGSRPRVLDLRAASASQHERNTKAMREARFVEGVWPNTREILGEFVPTT
jgi:hypothetical protein